MDATILDRAQNWANNPAIDQESRQEIQKLIDENNEEELVSRFYKSLEFGTAGIRGKMEAGLNRYNVYLVRQVSQGLATYLKNYFPASKPLSIAMGYDSRNGSPQFAQEAAGVFAANGIQVHLYPELRATPMVAYAISALKTTAGVVITASHNPPGDNGYKIYWSTGEQILSPHDEGITAAINQITDYATIEQMPFEEAVEAGKVQYIPDSIDQAFYAEVEKLCVGNPADNANFKAVYTPLHGTGTVPIQEMLKRRGFKNVEIVPEQKEPDGNFPTVAFPNPEMPDSFIPAQKFARPEDHVILANDPDSDRLGVSLRKDGGWMTLTGNQVGQLILEYYLTKLEEKNEVPADGFVVSTIVTAELVKKIAERHGLKYYDTLTGFKNIGKIILEQQAQGTGTFVFGMEDANGYLVGNFVKDKDGVGALMVFAEMSAELAAQGKTPVDAIADLYKKYGYHQDSQVTFVLEGKSGGERIQHIMDSLRKNPPEAIGGTSVAIFKDYQKGTVTEVETKKDLGDIGVGRSNVLAFHMSDGNRLTVRPSGTEPKVKIYFNLFGESEDALKLAVETYEKAFSELVENL